MSYTEQYFRIQIIVLYIALAVIAVGLISIFVINIYKKVTDWHIEKMARNESEDEADEQGTDD